MKRVKIMLSGVLVMAVVAGALAFNVAKKTNSCLFTYKTLDGSCAFLTTAKLTIAPAGATTLGVIIQKQTGQQCSAVAPTNPEDCNHEIRTTAE